MNDELIVYGHVVLLFTMCMKLKTTKLRPKPTYPI